MIVLTGPTASGKSEVAVALALRLGAEIVSADSRQVYRGLDAATAKPTRDQRARVAHHLINVAEPNERFDAARFAREASAAVDGIRTRGKVALVVGGTGLYLRALLEGLSNLPSGDEDVRGRLSALARSEGPRSLHLKLKKVDPKAAAAIDPENIQRLIRALEIFELTGKPISEHWAAGRTGGVAASAVLRLDVPAETLNARITQRATNMWTPLLAEVRSLVPRRWRGDEPGFSSLGYREALAVINGKLDEAQGLAAMIQATRAYAKRQRTWLRGQIDAIGVDATGSQTEVLARALTALESQHEASHAG